MFNSLLALAARTVAAVVCIGAASVSLAPAATATPRLAGQLYMNFTILNIRASAIPIY